MNQPVQINLGLEKPQKESIQDVLQSYDVE